MSFDTTIHDDLTIIGSPVDQFDVEGTPTIYPALAPDPNFVTKNYSQTLIENFATSGTPASVYVMGKSESLQVSGNFGLYIGRRLHADGTVDNVGQISGVFNGSSSQAVFFNYAGVGQGPLVVDQSHEVLQLNVGDNRILNAISANTDYQGFGYIQMHSHFFGGGINGDVVVYGPNTELFYYAAHSKPMLRLP